MNIKVEKMDKIDKKNNIDKTENISKIDKIENINKIDDQNHEFENDVKDVTVNNKAPGKNTGRLKKILLLSIIFFMVLLLLFLWLAFTKSGRRVIYKIAGNVIHQGLNKEEIGKENVIIPIDESEQYKGKKDNATDTNVSDNTKDNKDEENKKEPRSEENVKNFLLFGVEEIDNAKNTDALLIASINTNDDSIKLVSLLRDTYIESGDGKPHKLNSFFSMGGANKLVEVIEDNYRIKIDGYAYINFESFEKIVDLLGGIDIELGEEEAHYLNTTNYISNPAYRNVSPGWNHLNGNQTLGYCRIRMVKTLGGTGDDYGRTLRHQRVLSAIFNKYKSKGLIDLILITKKILGYVNTNVTQSQIEKALEDIIENKIFSMKTMRIPVNRAFEAPLEYNGVKYPIINDWDANIIELYKFIYLDTEEDARKNLDLYR